MSAILLCAGVIMTLVTAVLFGMAINEFMSVRSGQTGSIFIVYALATVAAFMCSLNIVFLLRCHKMRICPYKGNGKNVGYVGKAVFKA